MSTLQSIADAASAALAAVTSQLKTYFGEAGRLRREFIFPTLAFVLGCLAVLMAVAGPGQPRTWWEGLPNDLRLLLTGLLLLVFVLLVEVSRSLALTVKRLYSGEWPAALDWLWRSLRRDKLAEFTARDREQRALNRAYSQVLQAQKRLGELATPTPVGAAAKPILAVPAHALPAYQVITPADITSKSAETAGGEVASSPAQLIGRYALAPLAADQPVPLARLAQTPERKYLDPDARALVTIKAYPSEIGSHITPGTLATLYLTPVAAGEPTSSVPDVMIVDRPDENTLVLSLWRTRVHDLLHKLAHSDLGLARSPMQPPSRLRARPVAKSDLRPGQLLQQEQIDWELVESTPETGEVTSEATLLGRVYWPPNLDKTKHPLEPVLAQGNPFRSADLLDAPPQAEWLTYERNSKRRYRLGYALDLAPPPRASGEERSVLCFDAATGQSRPLAAMKAAGTPYPIYAGDRLTVKVDGEVIDRWCYVYHVDLKHCCLAVKDPDDFHQRVQAAKEVLLTPFCEVPVLRVARSQGQLIDAKHVTTIWFHANAPEVQNVYTDKADVVDHAVVSPTPILPNTPILRGSLKPMAPPGYTPWSLRLTEGAKLAVKPNAEALRRGVLVTLDLALGPEKESIHQVKVPVLEVAGAPPQFERIKVALPKLEQERAERLWQACAALTLTVTHSDEEPPRQLDEMEKELQRLADPKTLSHALSARDPDENALEKIAADLKKSTDQLLGLRRQIDDRPWTEAEDPLAGHSLPAIEKRFWRVEGQLKEALESWKNALVRIEANRDRSAHLTLPANLVAVRPTRLGNVLAAAADYPDTAYGIDTTSVLPRLLEALDPDDKSLKRLVEAEASLTMVLLFSFWSIVWTALGGLTLLAFKGPWWVYLLVVLGGPLLAWVTQQAAVSQAFVYGDALKSVVDLQRRKLWTALGLVPPKAELTPEEERPYWRHLYHLFASGQTEGFPALKTPGEAKGG